MPTAFAKTRPLISGSDYALPIQQQPNRPIDQESAEIEVFPVRSGHIGRHRGVCDGTPQQQAALTGDRSAAKRGWTMAVADTAHRRQPQRVGRAMPQQCRFVDVHTASQPIRNRDLIMVAIRMAEAHGMERRSSTGIAGQFEL